MSLKSRIPLHKVDPIAIAWGQLHKSVLPKPLAQSNAERAGIAMAAEGRKGKGKHVMAVCR